MTVVPLGVVSRNQQVINLLEQALDEAREGDIIAIGLAVVRPGNHTNCGFTDCQSGLLLGASALLQSRIIEGMRPK